MREAEGGQYRHFVMILPPIHRQGIGKCGVKNHTLRVATLVSNSMPCKTGDRRGGKSACQSAGDLIMADAQRPGSDEMAVALNRALAESDIQQLMDIPGRDGPRPADAQNCPGDRPG